MELWATFFNGNTDGARGCLDGFDSSFITLTGLDTLQDYIETAYQCCYLSCLQIDARLDNLFVDMLAILLDSSTLHTDACPE